MELIRGRHNLRPAHRGNAVSIGNFDGIHLGHRAVLEQLRAIGARLGVPATLVTFEPHPREFFAPEHAPPRLTRFREKMRLLARADLDRVLVLRFDEALASMSPDAFVEELLVRELGARAVVVGDDFRFGHRAEGNHALLRAAGARHGFEVYRHATYEEGGERVSSSRVRDALARGDLDLAARLLGRRYAILGRVRRGRELGRALGYPTANVALRRVATPLAGAFAVRVRGIARGPLAGMANVGTRPTVDGTRTLLEVHLLDWAGDLYGREICVEFVRRLRDERRFGGLDELRDQLRRDADAARACLSRAAP